MKMSRAKASSTMPFLVACVGIALFSLMDALVKEIVLLIGAYNGMVWRQLVATTIGGSIFIGTRSSWPDRPALIIAMKRGVLGAAMAFTFFWGIARVPLAEGIALSFIAPLIALYLAAVLLGESIGRRAILASALGFGGVLVIAAGRVGGATHDQAAWLGIGSILISAVLYGYNLILQRQQAQISTPSQIVLFQNAFAFAATLPFFPWLGVAPPAALWPQIILAAAITVTSLFLLAWAYARAEAQVLIPVEYTAFLWAALFGWLFFREEVTLPIIAGTVLIVAGCIIAARAKPAATSPTVENAMA
jgi:S-adenosylmethionine uptake transporter